MSEPRLLLRWSAFQLTGIRASKLQEARLASQLYSLESAIWRLRYAGRSLCLLHKGGKLKHFVAMKALFLLL